MEVEYSVSHHPEVIRKDIPALDARWRQEIRDAIRAKLSTKPDLYGTPLRQTLKGIWKLRVENYRILYRIEGKTIHTLIIGHRSKIYHEILKRLRG